MFKNSTQAIKDIDADIPFFITEYNAGLFTDEIDQSNAAAFIFRVIPELSKDLDMFSWWCFSDVFEEGGMSS